MACRVLCCFLLLSAGVIARQSDEETNGGSSGQLKGETYRRALVDAVHSLKAKGGGGFSFIGSEIIGAAVAAVSGPGGIRNLLPARSTTEDSFDRFFNDDDDDGLSFNKATTANPKSTIPTTTKRSHNVQRITKNKSKPVQLSAEIGAISSGKETARSARSATTEPAINDTETTQSSMESASNRPFGTIITRISDSIRSAVNETRLQIEASGRQYEETTNLNGVTPAGIDVLLRVLDAELLLQQWDELRSLVSPTCRQNMDQYVQGLKEHKLWALKMDDASGRYTSAFYWGNNYWTGSAHLCSSLMQTVVASAAAQYNSSAVGGGSEWREDTAMSDGGVPFKTAFYMLKLRLTTEYASLIKKRRTVHLGLCLPRACAPAEVGSLVGAARTPALTVAVLSARSDSYSGYFLSEDPTFRLLLGFTLAVCGMIAIGTWYDLYLSRRVRRARRRAANISGTAAQPAGGTADHKLDLNSLDSITMTNGKAIYNVNNNMAASTNTSEERLTEASDELKLSVWSELLLSFSAKANVLQIFDQTVGSDTIPVVHGLRSLSMVWVILGHACIVAFKYADNTEVRKIVEKEFVFQIVVSAVYSVDTFFCLGGLLVSFLYFRSNAKGSLDRLTMGKKNFLAGVSQFFGLIAYRFARLTTPYLFMLGVVEVTMQWFHSNSVFEPPTADHETCPRYWWRNILYINTLFPVEQMCMLWSWYLSDDSQFYALSAILLILATSHFKLAAVATGFFFMSSLVTTGYVSWLSNHIPNAEDPFTSFDKIYDKPWTRLGPYLVGVITGWILFKTNLKIRMSKVWVCVGWTASLGTLLFLVFGLYSVELDVASAAVYTALSHSLWAAAIAWIIIACSTGYGGWIHRLLSAPVLYPFSRVTYCAYLVHPVVIRFVAMQLDHPLHLSKLITIVLFLGMAMISYVLAFVVSVAFEAPVVTMLKILSPHKKPHRI